MFAYFFFFNDTATTEIYTLSLHDALPICLDRPLLYLSRGRISMSPGQPILLLVTKGAKSGKRHATPLLYFRRGDQIIVIRSEEHTSELQSRQYLVCRLLLEKKKKINHHK